MFSAFSGAKPVRNSSMAVTALALLPLLAAAAAGATTGCRTQPVPEPSPEDTPSRAPSSATTTTQATAATPAMTPPRPMATPPPSSAGPDPLGGKFSLADATKGLRGAGPLTATIDTHDGAGVLSTLRRQGAEHGRQLHRPRDRQAHLARPEHEHLDEQAGVRRDDVPPHHQGLHDPGRRPEGERLWRALATASPTRCGPARSTTARGSSAWRTAGPTRTATQFFITESDGPSVKALDGYHTYTIFGECSPVSTVHTIAGVPTAPGDRPITPVTINSIKISR